MRNEIIPNRDRTLRQPLSSGQTRDREDHLDEVRRAQHGDHDAFDQLAELHMTALFRLACVIVGPDDAADATQDALVRAWRDLPRLRDPDRFTAWLNRILVNGCRDRVRARTRQLREIRVVPLTDGPPDVTDHTARLDQSVSLSAAVARLPFDQRTVIGLHYAAGLTLRQAAEALGVPVGTAKSRLAAALVALRADLGEEER
jgi:RNA polymerase sigma-70 factor (ECF subfamily)